MLLDVTYSAVFCTLKPWIFGLIQDNYKETQKNGLPS
jgi:hypothetical protein